MQPPVVHVALCCGQLVGRAVPAEVQAVAGVQPPTHHIRRAFTPPTHTNCPFPHTSARPPHPTHLLHLQQQQLHLQRQVRHNAESAACAAQRNTAGAACEFAGELAVQQPQLAGHPARQARDTLVKGADSASNCQ